MTAILNLIGGELVPAANGKTLQNFEPATGLAYSTLPDSGVEDIERAVQAASRAFASWSQKPAEERAMVLRRIADRITELESELARAESIDAGKPLAVARQVDIPRSALNFRFFADAITQFATEAHAGPAALNYTLRPPLGIVGCISPWNLPLYLLTWKIAPALAAGNTVVAKPSEVTPMTAFLLSKIAIECGLPPGVLNIVHGNGATAGSALVAHSVPKAISFTGSTRVGEEIARVAGPRFRKLSLEMGGKNPTVVFADCDFDRAVDGALRAAYSNTGQICLCGSRILVERSIYDRFRDALQARVAALRVGDPLESGTEQGALVSEAHFEKVFSYFEIARKEGGRFLSGGTRSRVPGRCEKGWFLAPTLIEGLGPQCRTNQEEIFGPVATISPFDNEADALSQANSTRYGLAASVWTRDLSRAHRFAQGLEAGIVWINCWMVRDLRTPFGGVKDSGVGREGGLDALRFFTEAKNVCIQL